MDHNTHPSPLGFLPVASMFRAPRVCPTPLGRLVFHKQAIPNFSGGWSVFDRPLCPGSLDASHRPLEFLLIFLESARFLKSPCFCPTFWDLWSLWITHDFHADGQKGLSCSICTQDKRWVGFSAILLAQLLDGDLVLLPCFNNTIESPSRLGIACIASLAHCCILFWSDSLLSPPCPYDYSGNLWFWIGLFLYTIQLLSMVNQTNAVVHPYYALTLNLFSLKL